MDTTLCVSNYYYYCEMTSVICMIDEFVVAGVHNAEFVLTGIFRQEIDFHSYRII